MWTYQLYQINANQGQIKYAPGISSVMITVHNHLQSMQVHGGLQSYTFKAPIEPA
jgi:hypothetical protein